MQKDCHYNCLRLFAGGPKEAGELCGSYLGLWGTLESSTVAERLREKQKRNSHRLCILIFLTLVVMRPLVSYPQMKQMGSASLV